MSNTKKDDDEVQMIIRVERIIRTDFKKICLEYDESMQDIAYALINAYVIENRHLIGK